ncbi:MAG: type 4a pilus biogenesis protein PilO [Candidatus Taylorbacteria bacterium]|nr:type 4a pilus biogenesis protein PilO [Candidatus Taylorbacteria bacterium]
MKASKTAITILSILCLSLACGWAFLVYKAYSYKAEIAEASVAAKERLAESSYLASLRSLIKEEKEDIEEIEARFVPEEELPAFVEFLEESAVDAGIEATLGSLGLAAAAEGSSIAPLSISISAKGPWASIVRFVSALDALPYASKIESVSMTKIESATPEKGVVAWNARIEFVQYVEKAKK